MNYPPTIQRLIKIFTKFPTVGPRTAARFVFYLLKASPKETKELISAVSDMKDKIKTCPWCFKSFEPAESSKELCKICSDPRRDKSLLCVVEKETDLLALERTREYNGLYFILGGVISGLRKEEIESIRGKELTKRMKKHPQIKEIIIATNATLEGRTTALYLKRLLKPFGKKITRLGQGLPMGGELEYADKETLSSALEGRK